MRIYISGSLAFDRIMDFPGKFSEHILPDKIHMLNVCFVVNGLDEKFGGTAGNIAYSLALLGERPLVLSSVGRDFGPYEKRLRKLELPLDGIRVIDEEFTAGAYITTDKADNQITGFNPGAMKHSCAPHIDRGNIGGSYAIVSPGNVEDMTSLPRTYKELNIPYIFDPGQQTTALSGKQLEEALTGCAILVTNDYELEMIAKSTGLGKEAIQERVGAMITTLGEKGSVLKAEGRVFEIPATPVKAAVDPTGAGDAFRAGLLKALVLGKHLAQACRLGSACAAYAVEHHGTQEHTFDMEQVAARHREAFGSEWEA
jgi:adenosine kinase